MEMEENKKKDEAKLELYTLLGNLTEPAEKLCMFPKEHPLISDSVLARLGFRMTWYCTINRIGSQFLKYNNVFLIKYLPGGISAAREILRGG